MKITAYLLAFGTDVPIPERIIEVPDDTPDDGLLEAAFYYGQNDFQPQPVRSLSCGDVVKLPDGSLHKVLGVGWEALPEGTNLADLPRGPRASIC